MKLLFYPGNTMTVNILLANEIGLPQSLMLEKFYHEINDRGTRKDGHLMIARNPKQLKEMFPWAKLPTIKALIDKMQDKGLIFVSSNTMFESDTLWYGLNWDTIRTLKSVAVMTDTEIDAERVEPLPPEKVNTRKSPEESAIYKAVFAAYLRTCHWDRAIGLRNEDAREAGAATKKTIADYPNAEINELVAMVDGVDVWRETVLKQTRPFRPSGVIRNWQDYEDYVNGELGGNPPERENNGDK